MKEMTPCVMYLREHLDEPFALSYQNNFAYQAINDANLRWWLVFINVILV